jgi:hypothetical protein
MLCALLVKYLALRHCQSADCLSSLIRALAYHTLLEVVDMFWYVAPCHQHLSCHYWKHFTISTSVFRTLYVLCTPPTGNQLTLVWHPSHTKIKSHWVQWHLTIFPVMTYSWSPLMAVWQHRYSRLGWSLLTYSMEQSPSWESNQFSANEEIPHILWNPKVHYHVYKSQPPVPILSQINPVYQHLAVMWWNPQSDGAI